MVEAREHKPTLERAQETRLGHHSNVLGIRQVHVGIFDSVDHAPVSTQGTTSELAHVHGNYDGLTCFDRSLDLLPYFLASPSFVHRSIFPSWPGVVPNSPNKLFGGKSSQIRSTISPSAQWRRPSFSS